MSVAGAHREPAPGTVVRVWVTLIVLTAGEIALAVAGARGGFMLALLLAMSVAKSALILGWFMHLRFERRALALAVLPAAIVILLLFCFVFPDSARLARMRDAASGEARAHAAPDR